MKLISVRDDKPEIQNSELPNSLVNGPVIRPISEKEEACQ